MNVNVTLSFSPDAYAALPALSGSTCNEKNLLKSALRKARILDPGTIRVSITKKSIDARKKNDIRLVFQCNLTDEPRSQPELPLVNIHCARKSSPRPVIVGFGPAGMFAALYLAKCGLCPVIIERGRQVEKRVVDVNAYFSGGALLPYSNVQFGEGGAGTFSDGKLYSGISDTRRTFVLDTFARFGAPSEIAYLAHPHIGTDRLRSCVRALREEITSLGGTFLFERTVDRLLIEKSVLRGVYHTASATTDDQQFIETDHVLLAIGHSARDTFKMIHGAGITMTAKPFSVGLRIEHPQEIINRAQYGHFSGHPSLPQAEYKLVAKTSTGRSLYTFCMCPGGYVVGGASAAGQVVTNGMSNYNRDAQNANSAVLVGVDSRDFTSNHVLAGIDFQESLEHAAFVAGGSSGFAPCQRFHDFLNYQPTHTAIGITPSYKPGVSFTNLHSILPKSIAATIREGILQMNNKIRGFSHPDALLTGIETRSSSPVRIVRDDATLCSPDARGLYPCGEGAGYAGGIMSSAVDGLRSAEQLVRSMGAA